MLDAFLAAETRQVWALDRVTNEPFFLEDGESIPMRLRTRTRLRCPVPDCVGLITTVSGDKRHHFRHLGDVNHASGPETVNHAEAKWMLAAWFEANAPDGTAVTVERQAPGTKRIADVLVEVPGQQPLAVEVEYKSFTVREALDKQDDYDGAGVDCLWLLGHTRVNRLEDSEFVTVPAFAAALVKDGAAVLVVNPTTRQIGTLRSVDDSGHYFWTATNYWSRLEIDSIDDCWFVTGRPWIVTPAWAQIEGDEAARRAAEEAARVEAEEKARLAEDQRLERLREQTARRLAQAGREATQPPMPQREQSVLFTSRHVQADAYVFGVPPSEWRSHLFDALIHGKQNWTPFGWKDIQRVFRRAGIGQGHWSDGQFEAVRAYLYELEAEGWAFVVSRTEFAASGKRPTE